MYNAIKNIIIVIIIVSYFNVGKGSHVKGSGHIPTNILYFTLNISNISICRDLKQSQKRVKIECFVFTESYFFYRTIRFLCQFAFIYGLLIPEPLYGVQRFNEQNSLTRG